MDLRNFGISEWPSHESSNPHILECIPKSSAHDTLVLDYENIFYDISIFTNILREDSASAIHLVLDLSSCIDDSIDAKQKIVNDLKRIVQSHNIHLDIDITYLTRQSIVSVSKQIDITLGESRLVRFFIENPWKAFSDWDLKNLWLASSVLRKIVKKLKDIDNNIFDLVPLTWYKLGNNQEKPDLIKSIIINISWREETINLFWAYLTVWSQKLKLSASESIIIELFFNNPWIIYSLEALSDLWIDRGTFQRLNKKLKNSDMGIFYWIHGAWYYIWELNYARIKNNWETFQVKVWDMSVTIFPSIDSIQINSDHPVNITKWFDILKYLLMNTWEFSSTKAIAESIWWTDKNIRAQIAILRKDVLKSLGLFINVSRTHWYIIEREEKVYRSTEKSWGAENHAKKDNMAKKAKKSASSWFIGKRSAFIWKEKEDVANDLGVLWGYNISLLGNGIISIWGIPIKFSANIHELVRRLMVATLHAWCPVLIWQWNKDNLKLLYFHSSYADRISSAFEENNISMKVVFNKSYWFTLKSLS